MKTLFISDLHLDPERRDIQGCFGKFIHSCLDNVGTIDSLYILGDLFDIWLGDDASIPVYRQSIELLKQLNDQGIKVFIMHGNRDFLLGDQFARASGATIIPDLYHLTIDNKTILLSHGDIFCTDDKAYMQFREMVRDPLWQQEFLSKSITERVNIARAMQEQSKQEVQVKALEIMDVNQKTVAKIMTQHQVVTLIHGHTHRPATHDFILNNQPARRIVLPDWRPDATVFEICHRDN